MYNYDVLIQKSSLYSEIVFFFFSIVLILINFKLNLLYELQIVIYCIQYQQDWFHDVFVFVFFEYVKQVICPD